MTNRNRMSLDDKVTLQIQIRDELEEHNPQSVRHVFYRMTNPRLDVSVPKDDKGYSIIQKLIVKMRRDGQIPFNWIADSSRTKYYNEGADTPQDFVESMALQYRKNYWKDLDYHVEVWCESRSIAGVLQGLCDEYAVNLLPSGGFASDSFIYYASENLRSKLEEGKSVHIIYVGDYDPSGVLIDKDIRGKLCHHIAGGDWDEYNRDDTRHNDNPLLENFEFWRIAVRKEQITEYNLPTKPRKKGDKRSLEVEETVEAEAMSVEDMHNILRGWFSQFIPDEDFHVLREAEESERKGLSALKYEQYTKQ